MERLAAVRRYEILDTPPDGSFDRITALAARLLNVPVAIVTIVDEDRIWFKSRHGVDVGEIGRDPGLCASAILNSEPLVLPDASIDPRSLANPLVAGEFGLRFYAGAPLETYDGHRLGTLCVIDREPREITQDEREMLRDLAAVVMDQLELRLAARQVVDQEWHLREHAEEVARTLQQSLLPAMLPAIPGVDAAAFYEPARNGQVSGDFYDVFALDGNRHAVVLGDVCGKGTRAAVVTALARYTIRSAAIEGCDPSEVLDRVNRAMIASPEVTDGRFCTALVAYVDRDEHGVEVCAAGAGHPFPLLVRGGEVEALPTSGLVCGLFADAEFDLVKTRLAPGDLLVAYTDGVTDATPGRGRFGDEALQRLLASADDLSAAGVALAVGDAIQSSDGGLRDDVALVALRPLPY